MLFQDAFQDIRYALRQLRKSPGFTFTVVLTLALSVSVATAVFCVINATILRPLPYAHPERIVEVEAQSPNGWTQPASWGSYQYERTQAHSFDTLAAYSNYMKVTIDTPVSGPVLLKSVMSSDNFFHVFGVRPLLGRTYLPGEDQEGKNNVLVLSYEVWQSYFGGDLGVLNKTVKLNGRSYVVIGVMPASFSYPAGIRNAVYLPIYADQESMRGWGDLWLFTVGRIKDGVSVRQAQAEMTHIFNDMGKSYPNFAGGDTVHLELLEQHVTGRLKGPLWMLLGAALAVLAIGCVNVAGLLLARGVKREREMAMRVAIGADRARLLRQMLTEGLLLALAGAAFGVLLASLLLDGMRDFLLKSLPRAAGIHIDWTVLAAAVGLAVVTTILASLFPALRLSCVDPNRVLKAGGSAGTQRGQHRLRSGFVVTQVALTLVLLTVASMLMQVVMRYRHTDLGFDPTHILAVKINLSVPGYHGRDMLSDFYRPLEEHVRHLPGVQAAGLIDILPIERSGSNTVIHIAGQPPYPPNQAEWVENRFVSSGYFDAMNIPLHRGRRLSPSLDRSENIAATVVVNEAFVRALIPSKLDPTAQRIDNFGGKPEEWTRIVGVTGDVRQNIYQPTRPELDCLMDELDAKESGNSFANMTLLVRTAGNPKQIIPAVRSIVRDLDPTVPFEEPQTMTEVVSEVLVFQRMISWLFGIFAALALLLAMVGLYGLVSHEVEQATRDIGVRMALGATRNRILGMVLSRVAWMLAAGTVAGLALTLVAHKLIGIIIYFNAQKDATSFLLPAFLLVVAGLVAAFIPAHRAASVDPILALRSE